MRPSLLGVCCLYIALLFITTRPSQPVPEKWAARIASGCVYFEESVCVHEGCFLSPRVIKLDAVPYDVDYGISAPPRSLEISHTTGWVSSAVSVLRTPKSIACLLKHDQKNGQYHRSRLDAGNK